ncbi:nSTAND1 domain-containing NTPase [Enhygromyxa salina]|nr:SIR2 family protein [Enhygromyxa salina]
MSIDADLARAFEHGNLILCVGPAPSVAAGLPALDDLARRVLEAAVRFDPSLDGAGLSEWIARGRAPEVLEQVQHRLGAEFAREVERDLSDQGRPLPALVRSITGLRKQLRAIYTTRLDRLIERGLAGRWPSFSAPRADIAQRRGLLFKLRGTLEFPQSWVLTREQEEREFGPGAPRRAVFEAAFLAHQLLLIGFDNHSHELRSLLAMMPTQTDGQGPSHFIVLPECSGAEREQLERRGLRVLRTDAHALLDALGGVTQDEGRTAPSVEACPYPGLEAFREEQAALFFGRHAEVSQATALLGGVGDVDNRWLAIEGPSGVGKSSFARAGVVPALRRGFAEGVPNRLRVASMRPGTRPLHNLAIALAGALELGDPNPVHERLLADPRFLTTLAQTRVSAGEGVVLLIDQLEEMVTIAPSSERTSFGEAITRALDSRAIYLVTTTRSDLVPALQSGLPSLAGLLNELAQRYALPPISRAGLREAICQPAIDAGVTIAAELVEQILVDADVRPAQASDGETRTADAALPLVAHVLRGLWTAQNIEDCVITLDEYLAMGGIAGALSRSADHLVGSLGAGEQGDAKQLLLRLIRLQPDGTATRRVVELAEARQIAADGTIGQLSGAGASSARLLLVRDDAGRHEVELVHEALIRDWETLRAWIQQGRAQLLLDEELERQADKWAQRGRPNKDLPRGRDAVELMQARPHGPSRGQQQAFLAALARIQKRRRIITGVAIVTAMLGAVGVGALARRARSPVIIEACHLVVEGGPEVREAAIAMRSGEVYPTKVSNGRDVEFRCPDPADEEVTMIVNLVTGEIRYFPGARSGQALDFDTSLPGLPPSLSQAQLAQLSAVMPAATLSNGDATPSPGTPSSPGAPPSLTPGVLPPGPANSGGSGGSGGSGAPGPDPGPGVQPQAAPADPFVPVPPLIGYWNFDDPAEQVANWGALELHDGAAIGTGVLLLPVGSYAYAGVYQGAPIREKTFVISVELRDLGGEGLVMSIAKLVDPVWDGVAFATERWAGVNQSVVQRATAPEPDGGRWMKIAVSYRDLDGKAEITICRDGEQLARVIEPALATWSPGASRLVFGGNPNALDIAIEQASVYAGWMGCAQIQGLDGAGP